MAEYNHKKIEAKWQDVWEKTGINNTDLASNKPKFYNLIMFPYPSADYLHLGHIYPYSGADVYGRYKGLNGFNVFMPIGYDSFGLPAENYAIKKNTHPKKVIDNAIEHSRRQLKESGFIFDWSREVTTSSPNYYKWTQWLFLQLYKQGLAYQKESPVNWCPKCLTVLANEQVIDGKCDRCDAEVVQKEMKQWFLKVTDYADRLIKDFDKVDWPESSKTKQKNWIGRKNWIDITYKIDNTKEKMVVSTTRPDTNFGATFVVLAPEHPVVNKIIGGKFKTDKEKISEIEKYVTQTKKKSELERVSEGRKKTGVFTGLYAVNSLNDYKMPIWITDFVLATVGTGAVVGVPGHDMRDFEFATQFKLPIIRVVVGSDGDTSEITKPSQVQEEEGKMINSDFLNGMDIHKAIEKIMDYLEEKGWGKKTTRYRLHDWSIGRQRYWGAPIPVIYCAKCGIVPVPEKDLPVELPVHIKDFKPKGTGKGPLASVKEFVETTCPKCGGKAERETDTMDTFVCSSFYYLRYPSVGNDKEMMEKGVTKKWLPVDTYIGGAEHVTMHLLYARFIAKALYDAKLINFDEPFLKMRHQGMILGPDGKKMSKSKGNVINPDQVVRDYGADALRIYILFMSRFEDGGPWDSKGITGIKRFLEKAWGLYDKEIASGEPDIEETRILNKTIKKVGEDIDIFHFNTAISQLMVLVNFLSAKKVQNKKTLELLSIILSPFAPHMAEELWEKMGGKDSISIAVWPKYDKNLIKDETVTVAVQINGKVREQLLINAEAEEKDVLELAKASAKVRKYVEGKEIKKVIYIKGKLLSLVVG